MNLTMVGSTDTGVEPVHDDEAMIGEVPAGEPPDLIGGDEEAIALDHPRGPQGEPHGILDVEMAGDGDGGGGVEDAEMAAHGPHAELVVDADLAGGGVGPTVDAAQEDAEGEDEKDSNGQPERGHVWDVEFLGSPGGSGHKDMGSITLAALVSRFEV